LAVDRVVRTELGLIGAIYDAVLDPALWNDTVDRLRRHFDLFLGALAVTDLRRQHSIVAAANIPEAYAHLAAEHNEAVLDLWGGPAAVMRLPLEEPLIHSRISSPESWAGNVYYERFARPQGIVDQIVVPLEMSASLVAYFSMGLHGSMPPLNDDHIKALRVFAPHLRRAALIGNLLDTRREAAETFEALLNALGSAVVLVNENLHIVHANPQAETLLRAGSPIASVAGRLDAPNELVKGQLQRTILAATSPRETIGPASGIPVHRLDGAGAVLHVLPLQRRSTRPSARVIAAVFVAEPHGALNLPLEAIRMLYDLRPAEVRVFELIAAGISGRGAAEALGISPSTVKTHTVRLFDKLGVHTRAELVRFARDMSLGQ
jgi:DNA-binding CsgD family transcriptional regulator/PAS domain-containing protein